MTEPSPAATRSFVSTLVALAVVFVVTGVLQFGTPRSTSVFWARQALTAGLVWNQDWRVFTKVPVDADTVVYDARDLTPVTMYATSAGNRFGLSRVAYTQWMETEALKHLVPVDRWRSCAADTVADCRPVLAAAPYFRVTNPTREGTVCGPVVFAQETPIAWPEAGPATGRTRRTTSVVPLDVTCVR
jgi:hypothetical protein